MRLKNLKKDHLHSSFWGDEKRQKQNIKESRSISQRLTRRSSGYEKFRAGLRNLYSAIAISRDMKVIPNKENINRIKKMGSDYLLLNLRQEHRDRNMDK